MLAPLIQNLRRPFHDGNWRTLLPPLPVYGDPVLAEQEHFLLKLAETGAEVVAAQRLRYRVFKQEQGRLAGCGDNLDRDRFDRYCRHLLVIEKASGRVVGTYRVLVGPAQYLAGRFYSEEEFTIRGLAPLRRELCEVGRSCVDPEFRNGAVVALLWSGLAALRHRPQSAAGWLRRKLRHRSPQSFHALFGCVSLEAADPVAAMALYEYCRRENLVSDRLAAEPRPGFELSLPVSRAEALQYLASHERELLKTLPPLFKGYLKLGAKICGPPAFDREFGSIDFLILIDFRDMSPRYARHFLKQP